MTQAWDFVNATMLWHKFPGATPIDEIDWGEKSSRIRGALRCVRKESEPPIRTLGEIAELNSWDFLRLPNFGLTSLARMRAVLQAHGLRFAND